jgi:AcrR family transcriptional regulator
MPRAGLNRSVVTSAALRVVDAGGATGFVDFTLSSVAAEVDVAVPSLYKHVSSLAELRRDVAVASVTELTAVLAEATVGRAGDDALRAMALALRGFARAHPGRYAATQIAANPADPSDAALADAGAQSIALIAAVLRGFGLSPTAMVDAVRVVRAALHGFIVLELGGGFRLPDDLDHSFDCLIETVAAGVERMAQRPAQRRVRRQEPGQEPAQRRARRQEPGPAPRPVQRAAARAEPGGSQEATAAASV